MQTATIGFKNGQSLVLTAEKFIVTTSNVYGDLRDIRWEGLTGTEPLFCDLCEIIFVAVDDNVDEWPDVRPDEPTVDLLASRQGS